ncbi:hypothetical protein ACFOEY_00065 [Paracandidimonas soli]|uniref:hypothetical protein n=1 Tax=Paracandidimonas soli TaxID=1917182 RepID=UPI0036102B1F
MITATPAPVRLTANARLLDLRNGCAPKFTGTFAAGSANGFPASTLTTGAFVAGQGGTLGKYARNAYWLYEVLGFNASRWARTSSETRGANVALAAPLLGYTCKRWM